MEKGSILSFIFFCSVVIFIRFIGYFFCNRYMTEEPYNNIFEIIKPENLYSSLLLLSNEKENDFPSSTNCNGYMKCIPFYNNVSERWKRYNFIQLYIIRSALNIHVMSKYNMLNKYNKETNRLLKRNNNVENRINNISNHYLCSGFKKENRLFFLLFYKTIKMMKLYIRNLFMKYIKIYYKTKHFEKNIETNKKVVYVERDNLFDIERNNLFDILYMLKRIDSYVKNIYSIISNNFLYVIRIIFLPFEKIYFSLKSLIMIKKMNMSSSYYYYYVNMFSLYKKNYNKYEEIFIHEQRVIYPNEYLKNEMLDKYRRKYFPTFINFKYLHNVYTLTFVMYLLRVFF
ncbi:hypothetical protein PFTANZ_00747 [Plasmodium falciparum Tanzania (2000708)]|uniref:Uncharacterized protein n=1 Tax=Plasmodium falciparum Tanzania (2000708) TaxID=1036725 RepID=A0A024WDC8_PLAFA|nr:hypothetical protein PFTANZ_00747 [Plasmodium falciparum Tanzania (2000708)]